ncbi:uncharacterized protein J3D65DRAFT_276086 [Phyllosticta citribraziliensis]|uniref:Uncharacterized protein n=1 Tax=Phyllosticta citribraziliensis TaxID=989973 RepID=A0ABR1LVZ3_9PEZI
MGVDTRIPYSKRAASRKEVGRGHHLVKRRVHSQRWTTCIVTFPFFSWIRSIMLMPKRLGSLARCSLGIGRRMYSQQILAKLWDSMNEAMDMKKPSSRKNLSSDPVPPKERMRIQPLVFSNTKSDWVAAEDNAQQSCLETGAILPVVSWNLLFFGFGGYVAARSLAAMDHLRNIFGERPRPMALMLRVDLEDLRTILEHEWVRRNFAVGFDTTPFTQPSLGVFRGPKDSVMMVSKELRTQHWLLVKGVLSVDLPTGGHYGPEKSGKVLRLGFVRLRHFRKFSERDFRIENRLRKLLDPEFFQKELNEAKESIKPVVQKRLLKEIKEYMVKEFRPGDEVVAAVLGADIATGDHGIPRTAYRWRKVGAVSRPTDLENVRTDRVVDFFLSKSVERVRVEEIYEEMAKNGIRSKVPLQEVMKYGINRKVPLGPFPKEKKPTVASYSDMLSSYTANTNRSWKDHSYFGWQRNRIYSDGMSDLQHERDILGPRLWARRSLNSRAEEKSSKTSGDSFTIPSFAQIFTNDPRFNYDLHKGEVLMWVSDDYGDITGIKVWQLRDRSTHFVDTLKIRSWEVN